MMVVCGRGAEPEAGDPGNKGSVGWGGAFSVCQRTDKGREKAGVRTGSRKIFFSGAALPVFWSCWVSHEDWSALFFPRLPPILKRCGRMEGKSCSPNKALLPPLLLASLPGLQCLRPGAPEAFPRLVAQPSWHMSGLTLRLGCSCPWAEWLPHRSGSRIIPPQPGHTISIDCQDCICKGGTLTCLRKSCPQTPCSEPGFVPVPEALQAGQCCSQFSCGKPLLLSLYP